MNFSLLLFVLLKPFSRCKLISPCSLKDPELNECMKTQAKTLMSHLAAGVKEWGLPPIDPLVVEKIELHNSGNSAVNMELSGYNFSFKGFKDIEIESLKFDPKTFHLEMLVTTPKFGGNGQYKIGGQVLLLPINGEGYAEFSHDNPQMFITMDFKRVENGGNMFLKLDKCHFQYKSAENIYTYFDNLFGNKQLSDNMNKVMADNSQAMFKEMQPAIDTAYTDMVMVLFEPMFDRIPLNELFKDAE